MARSEEYPTVFIVNLTNKWIRGSGRPPAAVKISVIVKQVSDTKLF